MPDTHFMSLGQIDHKLWLLGAFPYFTLFITFGDERVAKNYYKILLMDSAGALTYI